MKIFYRFTDSGNGKSRPKWFGKKSSFLNFINRFDKEENEIFVVADNTSEDSVNFLKSYIREPEKHVFCTSLGNAASFIYCCDIAITQSKNINEIIYFAEDDYLYKENACKVLLEGIDFLNADYVTGYDHPDKYINFKDGGNPQIIENGERTVVQLTPSSHWKYTNSTTMTFATRIKTLIEDYDIICKYCSENIPNDYYLFCELVGKHNRKLASSIPGVSTHCEMECLSPLIEWEGEN